MAIGMKHTSHLCFILGAVSFILGVIAENIKPPAGTALQGKGVIICKYPAASYRYVFFGFLSFGFLVLSTIVGYASLSFPYNKRSIPRSALYASPTMNAFFYITWLWVVFGGGFILWPTLTELFHHIHGVHKDLIYDCPTAKTGLLGGGAMVALSSSFLWLMCLMLAKNAREDYFEEVEEARKGERTRVIDVDYDALPPKS